MNTRFRAYFAILLVGSLLLVGAGLHLQVHGVRALMGGTLDAGFAELIFGLLVAGGGVALLVYGWRYIRREAEIETRKKRHPRQPWLWRQEWERGTYVDAVTRPSPIVASAIVVVTVAAVTGYRTFQSGALADVANEAVLIAIGILSLALATIAIVTVRRWTLFGESRFELGETPVLTGSPMAGLLISDIPPSEIENCTAEAVLVCNRILRSNRRRAHSPSTSVVWRAAQTVEPVLGIRDSDHGHVTIPIAFDIPEGLPNSTPDFPDDAVEWCLKINVRIGRSTKQMSFVIPVFKKVETTPMESANPVADTIANEQTALAESRAMGMEPSGRPGGDGGSTSASPGGFGPDRIAHQSHGERSHQTPTTAQGSIAVRVNGEKTVIAVAPTKRLSFAAATLGFCLAWFAVVGYLAVQEAPRLLTMLAASFTVVPVYGALCIWYERTRLVVSKRGLEIERMLGPIRKRRFIPAADVGELLLSSFASIGSTNYFDLILLTKRGRRVLVVGRQAGQSSIEWIGFQINAALGRCSRVAFSGTVIGDYARRHGLPGMAADRGALAGARMRRVESDSKRIAS